MKQVVFKTRYYGGKLQIYTPMTPYNPKRTRKTAKKITDKEVQEVREQVRNAVTNEPLGPDLTGATWFVWSDGWETFNCFVREIPEDGSRGGTWL